jgi:hypothetical protein
VQAYQHRINNLSVETPASVAPIVGPTHLRGPGDNLVEETAVDAPLALGYVVGGLVGGALVGSGIGYVASGKSQGALTGAIAGAGVSATTNALSELFYGRKWLGAGYGAAALGALVYAWLRKP